MEMLVIEQDRRYFYADGYQDRQDKGENQKQLSKEFVRQWLIDNHFQGLEGQTIPDMPEEFVQLVTDRYIELFEKISGTTFVKADNTNMKRASKKMSKHIWSLIR